MRLVMACAVSQCSLHSFNFSDYTSGMHWRVNRSETLFSCLFVCLQMHFRATEAKDLCVGNTSAAIS